MPTLRLGYLRDDWLLLWDVLDPATAPADAGGVFFRPLARGLWWLAVAVGGDHPLAMHGPMLLLAILAAALAGAIARARGAGAMTWVAVAGVGAHAALLEPRLWAAASNGLLALTLGLGGWWWAVRPGASARGVAVGLVVAAGFARADGWAFVLPVALALGGQRAVALVAGAIAGGGGLALTLAQADAGWSLDPVPALRGVRMLLVPWGGPRAAPLEAAVALTGAALLFLAAWRVRGPGAWALAGLTLGVPLALALVPWGGAGRYLVVPVACGSILAARALPPRTAWPVAGLVLLHLLTPWFGSAAADLRARAEVETALYRAVGAERPAAPLRLVDPPPLGWTDSPADAENVASAALRRSVEVEFLAGPAPGALIWDADARRWRQR